MKIHRTNKNKGTTEGFTRIDNRLLENSNLSWKAKGIICYLLSQPEYKNITIRYLETVSSDKYKSIRSGLEELVQNQFLELEEVDNNLKAEQFYEFIVYEVGKNEVYPKQIHPIAKKDTPYSQKGNDITTNKEYIYIREVKDLNFLKESIIHNKENIIELFDQHKLSIHDLQFKKLLDEFLHYLKANKSLFENRPVNDLQTYFINRTLNKESKINSSDQTTFGSKDYYKTQAIGPAYKRIDI